MLPAFEKIKANINHSFYVNYMKVNHFPSPLHFHPEIEILLVIQGTGTRFVGNSVERFSPGDLVMIGENVPHVWYSDKKPYKNDSDIISEAIYIQFNKEIFGEKFWNLPESNKINKLLEQSQMGIKLMGKSRENVALWMKRIINSSDFSRILTLLSILEIISLREEYHFLASSIACCGINKRDSNRLNKVYKYVIDNFQQEIKIEKAASLASYSPSAFCRYFKTRTHKTFSQFMNEIRIGHACRLLLDGNDCVSEICYLSGFSNVSYFIKRFRRITGFTPLEYRKKYSK